MFEAGSIVAAEVRRVHHLDGELVLLGKCEEASGDLQHVLNKGVVNPVTDQVEETGIAGRFPKLFQETRALRRMTVEPAQVEGGQGLGLDGDRHGSLLDDTEIVSVSRQWSYATMFRAISQACLLI